RDVLQRALGVAVSIHENFVPASLEPNYRRFLVRNFQARARELGWISGTGESDDVRLLRPPLVSAMATSGGDQDLAKEARSLTDKWLQDHSGVPPEVLGA